MAYFEDLSDYCYHRDGYLPGTRNVGWLDSKHDFPRQVPTQEFWSRLWEHAKISVVQMRGLHFCELCEPRPRLVYAIKDGVRLQLGSSEIRVLSKRNKIYAAPTLIYHYVRTHDYRPPDEFIDALTTGLTPPNAKYFESLTKFGLDWRQTSSGDFPPRGFRSGRVDGRIQVVEIEVPTYVDEI